MSDSARQAIKKTPPQREPGGVSGRVAARGKNTVPDRHFRAVKRIEQPGIEKPSQRVHYKTPGR